MNKKLLLALAFAASSALLPLSASAHGYDNDHRPPDWREHREDLAWRERQRERRHEWYQWHKEHEEIHHLHVQIGNLDIDL